MARGSVKKGGYEAKGNEWKEEQEVVSLREVETRRQSCEGEEGTVTGREKEREGRRMRGEKEVKEAEERSMSLRSGKTSTTG